MSTFKLRARLLKLLGEELIGSSHLAIFELVKNAYDADSSNVIVNINSPNNINRASISILDDGVGMTLETIQNKWLELGTDNKAIDVNNNVLTPKYKRLPLGAKGVGRFAAYKLGNVLTVHTKTPKEGEYRLQISLDEALKNKYIDDVKVSIEKVNANESHIKTESGTEVIISGLLKPLERKNIINLNREILSIMSPFEYWGCENNKVNNYFRIKLVCKEYEDDLKECSLDDILESSMYRFKFVFENGELSYLYKFAPNIQIQNATNLKPRSVEEKNCNLKLLHKTNPVKEASFYSDLDRIEGIFYVYDLDTKILQYYNNKQTIKDYTKINSGVRVYRGGVRVYNYGIIGNDWLQLDQGRIDNPTEIISNRQIIGGIEILPSTTNILREKTNREGFIEDEHYEKFRDTIIAIVDVFNKLRNIDKEHLRKATDNKYKESIIDIKSPIEDLKKIITEEKLSKKVKRELEKVEKSYNQMRDIMLRSGMSGLQTITAIHEIEKTLFRLKNAIRENNKDLIKIELNMALKLIDGTSDLFKKDPIKNYNASEIINDVLRLSEDRFKRHNINLICPIRENKQKDVTLKIPKRMILSSIMNLIDNSLYWLSVRWYADNQQDKKNIYIGIDELDGDPAIIIADSGTGFPKGDWAELFRPFVTTKPMGVGMGLGLYYVKTIMDSIGGEISICDPDKIPTINKKIFDGAVVALIFRRKL